jgi:uncharacterized membrane protein YraQ (UPF0718 family)
MVNWPVESFFKVFAPTVISVFVDAVPFLMLGAFISSLVEVYLPQDFLRRFTPKGRFQGLVTGLLGGLVFPTCECGVVPVVRRLLKKGVPPNTAITYMLSAPVINPIVLASTYMAFQPNVWMVLGRVFLIAIPACCIGLAVAGIPPASLLRQNAADQDLCETDDHFSTVHAHTKDGACDPEDHENSRLTRVFSIAASEFLLMGKYFMVGNFIVGLCKAYLPYETLRLFEGNVFLAVGGMMLFAILLSVCSMADSFLAASLSSFPLAAQLSFISIGPLVDLKLIAMYGSIFKPRFLLVLITVPILIIYALSLVIDTMGG